MFAETGRGASDTPWLGWRWLSPARAADSSGSAALFMLASAGEGSDDLLAIVGWREVSEHSDEPQTSREDSNGAA